MPTREAAPTTKVMAISVGKKWPETIRAQPSKKSQMSTMIASQKMKHGSAAHFARGLPRKPATIGNQSGAVWTSWRSEPGGTLTAPTT